MAEVFVLEPDYGLQVEYEFKNSIKQMYKGGQYVNAQWATPLAKINFSLAVFSQSEYAYVSAFFNTVQGGQETFLFRDPIDDIVFSGLYLDTGKGILVRGEVVDIGGVYQCVKAYRFGSGQTPVGSTVVYKPITRFVPAGIEYSGVSFYLSDGVTPVGVSVDLDTGRISGPNANGSLLWSGQYYTPVRFENDQIPMEVISYDKKNNAQLYRIPDLRLKQVREANIEIVQSFEESNPSHIYQMGFEYNDSIDITFKTDIFESGSGFEDRDNLGVNRRKFKFQYSWFGNEDKEYLLGLWLMMIGESCSFQFIDTEANINTLVKFISPPKFTYKTLTSLTDDNVFSANGIELIEDTLPVKSFYCHLVKIVRADNFTLTSTDHDLPITYDSNLYDPNIGLSSTSSSNTSELNSDSTEITSVLFVNQLGEREIVAGIYDNAFVQHILYDWKSRIPIRTLFFGNIGGYSLGYKGSSGKQFQFESLSRANKLDSVNSVNVASSCPFEFLAQGGRNCNRAIDASVRETTTITASTSTTFDVAISAGVYSLGTVEFNTGLYTFNKYYIGSAFGNTIQLLVQLPEPPVIGTTVTLTRPCRKTIADCNGYNNLINFGGFPELMNNNLAITPPPNE